MNSSTAPQPRPVLRSTPPASITGVRITRRGRLVLLGLVAALAFALISLGQVAAQAGLSDAADGSGPDGSGPVSSGPVSSGPVSSTWVVQPGETLWVIAERLAPDTDPRETVARIVAMNDLPSSSVLVGQELQIPA